MLTNQQRAFARVLDLVEEAGCMPHVVLIGSWAEFAYREAGLLKGFDPNIRTMDVDFLIRNLRRPSPAASLASLAREKGFLVESDTLNGTTKLFDTSGLEVEFLIGKMGAGVEPALKTNVGVTAQTLRHLDILSGNSIDIPCLGHLVRVPTPKPTQYTRWSSTPSAETKQRRTHGQFSESGRFSPRKGSWAYSPVLPNANALQPANL